MEAVNAQMESAGRRVTTDIVHPEMIARRVSVQIVVEKQITWDHAALGGAY